MTLIRDFPTSGGKEFDGIYRLTYRRVVWERNDRVLLAIGIEDTSGSAEALLDVKQEDQPTGSGAGRKLARYLRLRSDSVPSDRNHGSVSHFIVRVRQPATSALLPTSAENSFQTVALSQLNQIMENSLTHPPLRQFLKDVFDDDTFRDAYLKASASCDYHHCDRGGLLVHSVDVVDRLARITHDEPDALQRQCALVAALLHDAGKLARSMLNRRSFWAREHTQMNAPLLEGPLARLRRHDEEAWDTLHYMFAVVAGNVPAGRMPIAMLLQALDHYSAARDGKERAFDNAENGAHIASTTPSTGGPRRVFIRSRLYSPTLQSGDRKPMKL